MGDERCGTPRGQYFAYGENFPVMAVPYPGRADRISRISAAPSSSMNHAAAIFRGIAAECQVIALSKQRDEIEVVVSGSRTYAVAGVRHPAGDRGGNRKMGKFLGMVSLDCGRVDPGAGKQLVELDAPTRIALAIDQAHPIPSDR